MTSPSCLCSASGASVVAIDNKIEQAMVSKITIKNNNRHIQATHQRAPHVKCTIRKQLTVVSVIFLTLISIDRCIYLLHMFCKTCRFSWFCTQRGVQEDGEYMCQLLQNAK